MNEQATNDMLHWVRERERVRAAKEAGAPQPWTEDPIIAKYRFCNVRREDDLTTRWIKKHVREPFANHPRLWFMLCAARQINWTPTLADLIAYPGAWPSHDSFSPETMAKRLNAIADSGIKVFTSAYIITAPSTKGAKKTDHVALKTLGALWRDRERFAFLWRNKNPRLEEVHAKLKQYDGWGDFMSYQAVVDMRYTALLCGAEDVFSWAAAGPGTIRGLNRLAGRPLDRKFDQYAALREMRELWPTIVARTGVNMDFSDVPNVMCETDKYLRAKNGEGKPKSIYAPGKGG